MSGTTPQQEAQVLMAQGLKPIEGSGHYPLLTVIAPQVGLPEAHLMYDAVSGRLVLVAPCGCHVHLDLSFMVMKLSQAKGESHADRPDGTHVH